MKVIILSLILLVLLIVFIAAKNNNKNDEKKKNDEGEKSNNSNEVSGEIIGENEIGQGMPAVTIGDNEADPLTPTLPLGTRGGTDPWSYSGEWRDRQLTTYGAPNHATAPFVETKENDMASYGYQGYNTKSPVPYNQPQIKYADNAGYSNCYPAVMAEDNEGDVYAERQGDETLAHIGLQRGQRDKKAQDGWASKNANYFKKFYSNELEEYEAKQWWGNNEY